MIKTVGVLGLGVFGSTIAKELGEQHYDVIAVDKDLVDVNRVEEYVVQAVQGNITDLELLESIGLSNCDAVVIGTGSNFEASVLAVMNCKKLGIKKIIAKAKNRTHMEILLEIGADEIIRPEKEIGAKVARNIMRNNILDVINLDEDNSIIEFTAPERWIGRSLKDLDLRKKYKINVIGMKSSPDGPLSINVPPEQKIEPDSFIVAIGKPDTFEHLDYTDQLR
ncbi:potassium channel family protein [Alkalibacterium thalassium]|uniref:Trk system potassium uptake protein TrkA n=1 Tax=Alkalibacterium thalassium TaxID=426701 RepID=A0A1G9AG00_9LACT|nr:TrkA family potassium uptake protein [Alkalibacterium thalassium]SDK26279.1 trk system potassium uptake protein TrkA [Alkalibacterium thalassium]